MMESTNEDGAWTPTVSALCPRLQVSLTDDITSCLYFRIKDWETFSTYCHRKQCGVFRIKAVCVCAALNVNVITFFS